MSASDGNFGVLATVASAAVPRMPQQSDWPVGAEVGSDHPENDDAVRLWLLDSAQTHLNRNAGMLGLGANVVREKLRVEREEIVARLQKLGEAFVAENERRTG